MSEKNIKTFPMATPKIVIPISNNLSLKVFSPKNYNVKPPFLYLSCKMKPIKMDVFLMGMV